ncbi:MAG: hypothetical protein E4H08_07575 [Candidatus Atribacteria bacterium]|nr:MAG: hypothetical protein E4H08_07575 [Candidatus Atribacteria bacterium]
MKKLILFVAALCVSFLVYAGEMITNDSGEDATYLRVLFSAPVEVTAFGDILTAVDAHPSLVEYLFSGGTVALWESHWMNWTPSTAAIVEVEWLSAAPAVNLPSQQAQESEIVSLGGEEKDAVRRKLLIVAHRGASQEAPENTIPAFELAWEQGADAIEGDFRLTQDGHIVCIHDATTGRIADADLIVSQSSLEQLRKLDAGSFMGEEFRGTVIPTLAEVLDTVPDGKKIYIEIKTDESIIPKLTAEIAASGLQDSQIVIISFNSDVIREIKAAAPQYKALWLSSFETNASGALVPTVADVMDTLDKIGADGFSSDWCLVDESTVETVTARGREYHVWSVNDLNVAETFGFWGAASITTDNPLSMSILRDTSIWGVTSDLLPLHVDGQHIVTETGEIVTLRGMSTDYPVTALWDGPILKRDLVMMKEWGANVVRVPIVPMHFVEDGGEAYLRTYVDPLVKWAAELDMYIIISWHTNGDPKLGISSTAPPEFNPDIAIARDAWEIIAARYKDCHWALPMVFAEAESITWEEFHPMMTDLVDIVRRHSPESVVLVPGVDWAADLTEIPNHPIDRANIVYVTDVYPWMEGVKWRNSVRALQDAGAPVLVAEWSYSRNRSSGHYATRELYGNRLVKLFDQLGVGWVAWNWTHYPGSNTIMFFDYLRQEKFTLAELVYDTLAPLRNVVLQEVSSPLINVWPEEAIEDGCVAASLLDEQENACAYTVLEATAAPGWVLSHWIGSVDYPESRLVSVPRDGSTVTAVFTRDTSHLFGNAARMEIDRVTDSWNGIPELLGIQYWSNADNWRRNVLRDAAESDYWELPGYKIRAVSAYYAQDALAIRWEIESAGQDSAYSYGFDLWQPDSSGTAVHIVVDPTRSSAQVAYSGGPGHWQELDQQCILAVSVSASAVSVLVQNFLLPNGTFLIDTTAWQAATYLTYPSDPAETFYFPQRRAYADVAGRISQSRGIYSGFWKAYAVRDSSREEVAETTRLDPVALQYSWDTQAIIELEALLPGFSRHGQKAEVVVSLSSSQDVKIHPILLSNDPRYGLRGAAMPQEISLDYSSEPTLLTLPVTMFTENAWGAPSLPIDQTFWTYVSSLILRFDASEAGSIRVYRLSVSEGEDADD